MSLFKRIDVPSANAAAPKPMQSAPKTHVALKDLVSKSPETTVKPSAGTAESSSISVYDALCTALDKHGERPRTYGRTWARIPAVWRQSNSYNISVCLKSGVAVDFADGEKRIEFLELMELLESDITNVNFTKRTHNEVTKEASANMSAALNMLKKATPISTPKPTSKIIWDYFLSRGLPEDAIKKVADNVRGIYSDNGGVTMLSPVYSPRAGNNTISIQRTFLTADSKKNQDKERALLGSNYVDNKVGGLLIQGDPKRYKGSALAVCEGLETGMAVYAATGMPVYVVYTANGMRSLDVEYLSRLGATSLLFCIDNDDPDMYMRRAGQDSCEIGAREITANHKIEVRMALPPRQLTNGLKCDWLDIWVIDPVGCSRLLLNAPLYKPQPERPVTVRPGMSMFNKTL